MSPSAEHPGRCPVTGLPWELAVCPTCRRPLSPLATPGLYAVHHMPGCARRCWTVCEFVPLDTGEVERQFQHPATTAEPRHLGYRRLDRPIRRAVRRRDFPAVQVLAAWGGPESACPCADCTGRRGGAR